MTGLLHLFGPPQITWNGRFQPLPFERRNQLVALLAVRRAWVARTELAELFWPGQTSRLAHANLRKTLFRLQALPWGTALEAQGNALRCVLPTDLEDFETNLREGRIELLAGQPSTELLTGYEEGGEGWTQWLAFERERVHTRWRTAVLQWLDAPTTSPAQAISVSANLLASDPVDESALLAHMGWLARTGQQGKAHAAYQAFESHLAKEFGLLPGPQAKAALDALALPVPAAALAPAPPVAPEDASFVGRTVELRQLVDALTAGESRLVALIGPGGIGKTRLAQHALRLLARHFGGAVHFVPLEDLEADGDLSGRIARTLGVAAAGAHEPLAQVVRHVGSQQVLLVLDNFEHLQGAAACVAELLAQCPRLQVLITSRVRPALPHAQTLVLDGLPCPDPEDGEALETFDAVRLFVRAARRVEPAFNPVIEAMAVIDICRRVEGLPLALEIAAAWTRVLSCAAIAEELRQGARLLEAVDATLPARHASMEIVFAQSWALLTPAQREALARLSVFRGGFTAAAARAVAGAALPVLGALADQSLLRKGGERLQLHPLLQQLAAARLDRQGGLAATEAAHAQHFHRLLAQLRRPSEIADRAALDELEAEFENCRQAWMWAVREGRADLLARTVATLRNYVDHRARCPEGLKLVREALAADHPALAVITPLLRSVAAHLEYRLDRYADAIATAERAMETAAGPPDHDTLLQCFKTLGSASLRLGRHDDARRHFQEALRLAPESADPRNAAAMLDNLSLVEKADGQPHEALKMSLAALAGFRQVGDVAGEALCLNNIAVIETDHLHDAASGRAHLEEGLALCERHQLVSTRGIILANLSEQCLFAGDLAGARSYAERALEVLRAAGNRGVECWLTVQLAQIALRAGRLADARVHLRAALELALALQRTGLQWTAVLLFADLLLAMDAAPAAQAVWRWSLVQPGLPAQQRHEVATKLGDAVVADAPGLLGLSLSSLAARIITETPVSYRPLLAALRASH